MHSEYEYIVRLVCGEDWDSPDKSLDEKDGAFGVGIVLAYLQGVPARLMDLAKALGVESHLLGMAYKRLQVNGIFSPRSPILTDDVLLGKSGDDHNRLLAWCHIAGLSSGFIGKGFLRNELMENDKGS